MNKKIQNSFTYSKNKQLKKNLIKISKRNRNKVFPKKDYEPYIPMYDRIDAL